MANQKKTPHSSVLTKITLRGIRDQFGRFLMTVLAVSVGTAFLVGVLSLRGALSNIAAGAIGGVAVYDGYIMGEPETTPAGTTIYGNVTPETATEAAAVPGTSDVRDLWIGTALLYNAEGDLILPAGMPAFVSTTFAGSKGPSWAQGHAPERVGEVAVEASGANQHDLNVGDHIELGIGGEFIPQEIVGIYEYEHEMAGAVIFFLDPETAETLLSVGGPPSMVGFNFAAGTDGPEVLAAVQDHLGDKFTVLSTDGYQAFMEEQASTMLSFLTTFLLVFIAIALFITTFIIANTFQMSVRARQREFALLRAVGASSGQIFGVVAIQAIVVGLIGGGVGLLLGWLLTLGASAVLGAMGLIISGGLPLTVSMGVISLIVGVVVTLVSAVLPATDAARTAPVEAMRSSDGANPRSLLPRTLIGSALLIIGLGLLTVGALRLVEWDGIAFGVGSALTLLAVLMLSAALAVPISIVLSYPIRLFARTEGRLAVKNLIRNSRRTSATAGALLVGVALVSAGAVLAASVKDSLAAVVDDQLQADLLVQSADIFAGELPEGLEAIIAGTPGVISVNSEVASAQISPVTSEGETLRNFAAFINPNYLDTDLSLTFTSGDVPATGEFIALDSAAEELGVVVGDEVEFMTASGPQLRTLAGTVDFWILSVSYIFPFDDLDLASGAATQDRIAIFVDVEGRDVDEVKAELRSKVRDFRIVTVSDVDDVANQAAESVNQVMAVLYALLGLSMFVAAIGIVNTMTLSVSERVREFGLLRAVGMGRGSIGGMIVIESVLTSIFATILGCFVGVGLAAALRIYLKDSGLSALTIPVGQLLLFLVAAVVLGVVAALFPALRASRVPVLQAITTD